MSNARFQGGASVILHRGGHVLLQKRTADAPMWPSYWGTFGGRIEPGETAREAAAREIREELGFDVAPESLDVVCEFPIEIVDVPGNLYFFAAPLPVSLDSLKLMEGDGFALLSREEVRSLPMIPGARRALERYFADAAESRMTGAA